MARLDYPPTRRGDVVEDLHGTRVADPYRWLEEADADEVAGWVAQQGALARSWLDGVGVRQTLRDRLEALWDHPRRGVPWRRGERWFALRNSGLQPHDVLAVADSPDDEGAVLLDPVSLSPDQTTSLSGLAASADGRLLAYATSDAGSDWQTWRVRPSDPGAPDLDDELCWSKFSTAAWLPDGSGFYYGRYDQPAPGEQLRAPTRGQRLCLHRLGTPQDTDVVVAASDDPEDGFDPHVTDDGRFLVVTIWRGTDSRTRLWVAPLDGDPAAPAFVRVFDDHDASYAFVGNVGSAVLVRTDADAPRGRIVVVDATSPDRVLEVVGQSSSTLESAHLYGGRLVLRYLDDARSRLQRFGLDGTDEGAIAVPGTGTVEELSGLPGDRRFFFSFTSFTRPTGVCVHDLVTGETGWHTEPGLDIDDTTFSTEQVFVTSTDGVQVPMFLVRRADLPRPSPETGVDVPTLLYGYGGFSIPLTPAFRVAWLVWLELGGQLAVANLRGGGEYGEQWHDAGRLGNKQQVFDDAIACAGWLVEQGWTTRERLALNGRSNGGLLAGACLVQRPDLFGAVVPEFGVLDLLRYHRFTIGWAWASEYGTADDPEQLRWLLRSSPLHNVWPRTAYPATLVVTSDHDDRVVPAHSYKFAATLQRAQAGDAPVLLRVQPDAGHGAGTPTSVAIEERADVLAFLVRSLAMDFEEPH